MSAANEGYSFAISIDDFDETVLPSHARTPGTDEFSDEVSRFFQKEFAAFKGNVRIVVDAQQIEVGWQSDPNKPHPMQAVKEKLERGEFPEAIRLLEILRRYQPNDVFIVYNLGVALSEDGQFEKAEHHLRHAVDIAPNHANARVALGVALVRQARHEDAVPFFREAVEQDPTNLWAIRNLGGCLLRLGQVALAEECLRRAVELDPTDQQAVLGCAQVLHVKGELKEADNLYLKVIELDERSSVAEVARKARTELAQISFRKKNPERPDAVMYCLGAIQKFEKMNPTEVQKIGFEIAMLGQRGLDTNDPTPKYRLKSLPGDYSGLNLVCLMYVAFKIIAPQEDMGFDLSKEYGIALAMHSDGDEA